MGLAVLKVSQYIEAVLGEGKPKREGHTAVPPLLQCTDLLIAINGEGATMNILFAVIDLSVSSFAYYRNEVAK